MHIMAIQFTKLNSSTKLWDIDFKEALKTFLINLKNENFEKKKSKLVKHVRKTKIDKMLKVLFFQ